MLALFNAGVILGGGVVFALWLAVEILRRVRG